jgi:RNA polymerase sigma factor (sigma-70 family)
MTDSSPQELELTSDLLEYAKMSAQTEAHRYCRLWGIDGESKRSMFDDAVQDALLHLVSKPPRFDPARGASPRTLIYTIVQRAVAKSMVRALKHAGRFQLTDEPEADLDEDVEDDIRRRGDPGRPENKLTRTEWTADDILQFIDNEESRALCRLFIQCNGNASKTARRMGVSEGTVRYRLTLLGPKLLAAGFNPFSQGGVT